VHSPNKRLYPRIPLTQKRNNVKACGVPEPGALELRRQSPAPQAQYADRLEEAQIRS
jgi:hypothetical protein